MKAFSIKLANFLLKKKAISQEDYSIYQYGLLVSLELICTFFTVLFVMIVLNCHKEGLIILGTFSIIRMYSGGLHLKHFYTCYFMSCIVLVGSVIGCKYNLLSNQYIFFINLFLSILILTLGPVSSIEYEVSKKEYEELKQGLFVTICIIELLGVFLWNNSFFMEYNAITIGIVLNVISIIIAKVEYRIKMRGSR